MLLFIKKHKEAVSFGIYIILHKFVINVIKNKRYWILISVGFTNP